MSDSPSVQNPASDRRRLSSLWREIVSVWTSSLASLIGVLFLGSAIWVSASPRHQLPPDEWIGHKLAGWLLPLLVVPLVLTFRHFKGSRGGPAVETVPNASWIPPDADPKAWIPILKRRRWQTVGFQWGLAIVFGGLTIFLGRIVVSGWEPLWWWMLGTVFFAVAFWFSVVEARRELAFIDGHLSALKFGH